MRKSIIAVCVGAPLLALGVGAAPAAWAATGDNGASVNINGTPKHQGSGYASSEQSTGTAPNISVAVGGSSTATNYFDSSGTRTIATHGGEAITIGSSN